MDVVFPILTQSCAQGVFWKRHLSFLVLNPDGN